MLKRKKSLNIAETCSDKKNAHETMFGHMFSDEGVKSQKGDKKPVRKGTYG